MENQKLASNLLKRQGRMAVWQKLLQLRTTMEQEGFHVRSIGHDKSEPVPKMWIDFGVPRTF